MTGMISFLPILFIIGIITFFILLNKRYKTKPVTFDKAKWIIIGYVSILFISTLFSSLLPKSEAVVVDQNFENHWQNSLYQKALDGNFSTFGATDISESWEFPLTSNTLSLESFNYEEPFLIERTNDLVDKVELYFIADWQVMEVNSIAIDISEYIPDVNIELEQNSLQVKGDRTLIQLGYAEPNFTVVQFLKEYESGFGYSGSRFFYIRIPENVTVDNTYALPIEEVKN